MKQFHIIYKTTNLVTNEYYIGIHSTDDIEDGYLGSGVALRKAIAKYGRTNFAREILFTFDFRSLAIIKEAELVTKQTIQDQLCYNLVAGGGGNPSFDRKNTQRRVSSFDIGKWSWEFLKRNLGSTISSCLKAGITRNQILNTLQNASR